MKRFYKVAAVEERPGGFAVLLDGRAIRTPAGAPLAVPTRRLADAIAADWAAQGDIVQPATMPAMQLASTAIDRVAPQREAVIAELLRYAETDLVCYRADSPAALVRRQAAAWQPIVDWVMLRFDAGLRVTTGILPVPQPAEAVAALRRAVEGYDDWRLCALQSATAACGSLLLALGLVEGRVTGAQAFEAAQLEELCQAEQWGDDPEAAKRRAGLRDDILAVEAFLAASRA